MCGIEHAVLLDAVDVEIGLHFIIRDAQHFLLHLGRIVEAVVGLQLEVGTHALASILFNSFRLGVGLGLVGSNELFEEAVHAVGGLGHRLLERERGVVAIAHQLAFLGSESRNLGDDGERVESARSVGTMNRSFVDTAAQVAVVKRSQKRLLRGVDDDDAIGSLAASALRIFRTLGNVGFTQSSQLLTRGNPNHGVVGRCGKHVAPLLLKLGNAHVDLLHAFHLLAGKQGARTDKAFVDFFQKLLVFALQLGIIMVVDVLDALEELLVERDFVLQVGQHGCHLLLRFGYDWRLVGAGEPVEDARDAFEQHTALLESQHRVLERRFLLISNYAPYVGALFLNSFLDGRQIVSGKNLVEVGCAEGQGALFEQGVHACLFGTHASFRHGYGLHHYRCQSDGQ